MRRSQLAPPSSVAKTPAAEMPTQSFAASAGSATMVCSTSPAAPGFQLAAEGWSVSASIRAHVAPRSWLASRLAGLVPAWSVPCEKPSDQICVKSAPKGSGSGVQPIIAAKSGSASAQSSIVPRVRRTQVQSTPSSVRQIPAPCQSLPPPAQIVPVSGSPARWLIGQPSQNGPEISQLARALSPVIRKAPLVVPVRIVMSPISGLRVVSRDILPASGASAQ